MTCCSFWTFLVLVVLELIVVGVARGLGLCLYNSRSWSSTFTFIPPHRNYKYYAKPKAHDIVCWNGNQGGNTRDCPPLHPLDNNNNNNNPSRKVPRMSNRTIPLEIISYKPLLLISTGPVLTSEECQHLIRTHEEKEEDEVRTVEILMELNQLIAQLTNCPHHNGETECPRYISYHAQNTPPHLSKPSTLLPDGLHIDINNGKLFRHITVLLYLTDNHLNDEDDFFIFGGATTFPFAIPLVLSQNTTTTTSVPSYATHQTTSTTMPQQEENISIESCARLVERGIYHTSKVQALPTTNNIPQQDDDTLLSLLLLEKDRAHIEQVATQLFLSQHEMTSSSTISNSNHKDLSFRIHNTQSHLENSPTHDTMGIRITPQKGRLCIFYSWDDDGHVDPRSFHGGEAIFKKAFSSKHTSTTMAPFTTSNTNTKTMPDKALLTFFKEVPITTFQNMQEFRIQVGQSRQWAIQQYSKIAELSNNFDT